MYIFHRTSEEKIQSEAPLRVVHRNFISTVQRTKSKKKKKGGNIPQTGNSKTLFSSYRLGAGAGQGGGGGGAALAVHGFSCGRVGGRNSANVRVSLARPNELPPLGAAPVGNIHAVREGGAPLRRGSGSTAALVDHLVNGGLLVPGARYDVLVVRGDVAAQHRRGFLGLAETKRRSGEGLDRRVANSALLLGARQFQTARIDLPTWNMLAP